MLFSIIILLAYTIYDGSASIIFPGPELMSSTVYDRNHMTAAESENRHSVLVFFNSLISLYAERTLQV